MTVFSTEYGPIDTVVCDIDGVVVLGKDPVPGAGEALVKIQQAGLNLLFATNNSTKTRAAIATKLFNIAGFEADLDTIVSSGAATAQLLAGKVEAVYVVGTQGLRETLGEGGVTVVEDWRAADAVVTGLDFNLSYDMLVGAALAVQHGATFYATNSDSTYPTSEGLYPGAGSIAAVVERATGIEPIVCGKPFAPMRATLQQFGGDHPLIVGDRPDTDLALGKVEGWATALVLTGVTADPAAVPEQYKPDIVLE
ncbi:MAG: HAD-IIA family hydrolase, partial [bacterium]|nr:HAD-IIA family hydrolase [bacterium]